MSLPARPIRTPIGDYLRVAWFYDRLASLYSLGAIDRSRRIHLDALPSKARVLYAGAGTGQEAMLAASLGHSVQLWDPSAAMLERARARAAKLSPSVQSRLSFVQAPVEDLPDSERFDAVVCNYFLNLFAPSEIPWWLARLRIHLEPQGSLWIADFAPLASQKVTSLQRLYHTLPLRCFERWTQNARHHPYDYASFLVPELGWSPQSQHRISLTPLGPGWFACWHSRYRP